MSTPGPFSKSQPAQPDEAGPSAEMTSGYTEPTGKSLNGLEFLAPPEKPDEIGRLAHYRVFKQLGAGGMGIVFQAEDTTLDRPVALKVMHGHMAANATARERFIREAKTAAAVKHDHIVSIYQVGQDRGVPFIALEFLQGQPLDTWLGKNTIVPTAQALRIGREMADGLAAAHARGLIHRDIKPANIWLEAPKGRVKILDFGLARATNDDAQLTREGAVVGTPAYMSPEQASGVALDARTDLFSLGVVLYRMLTGVQPFTGNTTLAVLMSLGVDNPTPVIERNPQLPQALSDLTMRLLSKDRDGRPASAAEVSKELQAIARKVARGSTRSGSVQVLIPVAPQIAESPVPANPYANIDSSSEGKSDVVAPVHPASGSPQRPDSEGLATQAETLQPPPNSKKKLLFVGGLVVLLLAIVGGVIITLNGKDGKIAVVEVRDGSNVKNDPKGTASVTLPKETAPKEPVVSLPHTDHGAQPSAKGLRWPLAATKPEDLKRLIDFKAELTLRSAEPGQRPVDRKASSAKELPTDPATLVGLSFSRDARSFNDAELAFFGSMIDLESLTLAFYGLGAKSNITAAGMQKLAALRNLKRLSLQAFRKEHFSATEPLFATMPNLEFIALPYDVHEGWFPILTKRTSITELKAFRSDLKDHELAALETMTWLRSVDLRDNHKLSEAAIRRFAAAIPGCRILWGQTSATQVIEPTATLTPIRKGNDRAPLGLLICEQEDRNSIGT